jgi:hypothetical protein
MFQIQLHKRPETTSPKGAQSWRISDSGKLSGRPEPTSANRIRNYETITFDKDLV